jgi:hypothetical protein
MVWVIPVGPQEVVTMREKKLLMGAVWLLFTLTPTVGSAFYCGHTLIVPGDTNIEVIYACGQPDSVESWDEVKNVSHFLYGYLWYSLENVHVEQWIYNFGPSRFIRILRFENGILKHIKTGNYGFPK